MDTVSKHVEDFPGFPHEGIVFKDISRVLADYKLRNQLIDDLYEQVHGLGITQVVGLESRGFLGISLADKLKCGFVMVRKPSKLPGKTLKIEYSVEYRKDNVFEMRENILKPSDRVLIFDDLMATGGSAHAAAMLSKSAGAFVIGIAVLIELEALGGRAKLSPFPVFSCLKYDENGELFKPVKEIKLKPLCGVPDLEYKNEEREYVIFCYKTMLPLANQLKLSFPGIFRIADIKWDTFPDGYPNMEFEPMDKLEHRHVIFIGSLQDQATIFQQLSVCLALTRQFATSMHVVFPYFAPGTMERVDSGNQVATAETLSKIMGYSMVGTTPSLRIFDIHTLHNRFYFPDTVCPKLMSAVEKLLLNYIKLRWRNKLAIVFPDDGAYKRFGKLFPGVTTLVCSKIRDGDKRYIEITQYLNQREGPVENVLIVDDLVQSGGTLDECRKALSNLGAKRISCYVTHPVFPEGCYGEFIPGRSKEGFDTFLCTDTIPETTKYLEGKRPFEVLHIAPVLGEDILKPRNMFKHSWFTVFLGSRNRDKEEAVEYVMKKLFPLHYINVVCANVESGVERQPFGITEIEKGAINRAVQNEQSCLSIGIENGLVFRDGKLYDIGVVCARIYSKVSKKEETFLAYTEEVQVPSDVVRIWFNGNRGNAETIGELINQRYGYDVSDWHVDAMASTDTNQQISLLSSQQPPKQSHLVRNLIIGGSIGGAVIIVVVVTLVVLLVKPKTSSSRSGSINNLLPDDGVTYYIVSENGASSTENRLDATSGILLVGTNTSNAYQQWITSLLDVESPTSAIYQIYNPPSAGSPQCIDVSKASRLNLAQTPAPVQQQLIVKLDGGISKWGTGLPTFTVTSNLSQLNMSWTPGSGFQEVNFVAPDLSDSQRWSFVRYQ